MKITTTLPLEQNGSALPAGTVLDVPDADAKAMVDAGRAKLETPEAAPAAAKPADPAVAAAPPPAPVATATA